LCTGPCDFIISRDEYLKNIDNIKKFFKGEKKSIINDYVNQIDKFVKEERFEDAAKIRDKIEQIKYVSQNINVDFGEDEITFRINKVQDGIKATKLLFKKIGNIKYTNGRIECYDISNIQGKYPVSSMVVFKGGQILKSDYRKFKIKTKDTPDDPAMMYETVKRRITNSSGDKSFSEKPDLIIVDGGKTQLGSAIQAMKEVNISIPILGLAKRHEEIILPNKKHSLKLRHNDISLLLIRKIRDEAHRFANTFHKKLRSKGMIGV
jgi:excinuclease ABC subunit C